MNAKEAHQYLKMIEIITLGLSILGYSIGEGVTEGFTWAPKGKKHRLAKENKLIIHSKKEVGSFWQRFKFPLGYHQWRDIERLGIGGSILSAYFFSSFGSLALAMLAFFMVGLFFYEQAETYVSYNRFFVEKNYKWSGYEIPMGRWLSILPLVLGIGLLFLL